MSWFFRTDKNGDGMKGYLDNVDTVERNLKDAGCDETLVKEFIILIKTGERKRQLRMLEKHRSNLLEEIHKNEKKIECLDYLVCQMEKKMGKKIVVLSTSPRMGGNSEMMADAFIRGAAEAGHEAEKIHLYDKKIELINSVRIKQYGLSHSGMAQFIDSVVPFCQPGAVKHTEEKEQHSQDNQQKLKHDMDRE